MLSIPFHFKKYIFSFPNHLKPHSLIASKLKYYNGGYFLRHKTLNYMPFRVNWNLKPFCLCICLALLTHILFYLIPRRSINQKGCGRPQLYGVKDTLSLQYETQIKYYVHGLIDFTFSYSTILAMIQKCIEAHAGIYTHFFHIKANEA